MDVKQKNADSKMIEIREEETTSQSERPYIQPPKTRQTKEGKMLGKLDQSQSKEKPHLGF